MEAFLEITYHQKGKDSLYNQRHTHADSYEMIQTWTESGNVLIRDKVYPMRRGALFFIRASDLHATNPSDPAQYERSKVVVSEDFLDQLAKIGNFREYMEQVFFHTGGTCFLPEKEQMEILDGIFRELMLAGKTGGAFQKGRMTALLLMLIGQTVQQAELKPSGGETRLTRVVDYINDNLQEPIAMEDICRAAGVSRYYLCRLFKKTLGMTVSQYIMQRRLSLAREMLVTTDKQVSEVAFDCGFSSFAYFSRMFREAEGCSPRTYRNVSKNKKVWT